VDKIIPLFSNGIPVNVNDITDQPYNINTC